MNHEIQFFYRSPSSDRPEHVVQDNPISDDQALEVPISGDTVSYMFDGDIVFRKVESRHLIYTEKTALWCIVVTDVNDEEMLKRLSKY